MPAVRMIGAVEQAALFDLSRGSAEKPADSHRCRLARRYNDIFNFIRSGLKYLSMLTASRGATDASCIICVDTLISVPNPAFASGSIATQHCKPFSYKAALSRAQSALRWTPSPGTWLPAHHMLSRCQCAPVRSATPDQLPGMAPQPFSWPAHSGATSQHQENRKCNNGHQRDCQPAGHHAPDQVSRGMPSQHTSCCKRQNVFAAAAARSHTDFRCTNLLSFLCGTTYAFIITTQAVAQLCCRDGVPCRSGTGGAGPGAHRGERGDGARRGEEAEHPSAFAIPAHHPCASCAATLPRKPPHVIGI